MDLVNQSVNGRFPRRTRRFEYIQVELTPQQLSVLDDYARVAGAATRSEAIRRLIDSLSRPIW